MLGQRPSTCGECGRAGYEKVDDNVPDDMPVICDVCYMKHTEYRAYLTIVVKENRN